MKIEGVRAVNPVNGKEIPIFISDYVLISYGTGAIMAVPAHDDARLGVCQEIRLCRLSRLCKGGDVQKSRLYRLRHRYDGKLRLP